MTSSLALLQQLQKRNLISKEAAAEVLARREELLNSAIEKQAALTFDAIRSAASAVGRAPGNLLSKLRIGGKTGGGTKDPSGWSDVTANLGKMLALAGLTTAATSGASALVNKMKQSELNKQLEKSYSSLIKDKAIQESEKDDPGHTAAAFGVLARFSPSLAAEPLVAKKFVLGNPNIREEGVDHGTIDVLTGSQKRIDEYRTPRPAFSPVNPFVVAKEVLS